MTRTAYLRPTPGGGAYLVIGCYRGDSTARYVRDVNYVKGADPNTSRARVAGGMGTGIRIARLVGMFGVSYSRQAALGVSMRKASGGADVSRLIDG
eukprot:CAMPEP_0181169120 /NCGR_PEP_ID=MMETSP1096-20121128/642_1 /TAXON_ID=156174 ORGANISM="Chrysochromulina ericina, Strain CCMP281" /NCGR_SAMPLE_ID=MMETSP1096 /ASSEMBLY_ACC=CAM_ASM_000453 /LENGTH=95 /DNA_ID=CAMNT_0023256551 /DNA_START=25 /DNA_END=312 /DNA_ORIENTATION=-